MVFASTAVPPLGFTVTPSRFGFTVQRSDSGTETRAPASAVDRATTSAGSVGRSAKSMEAVPPSFFSAFFFAFSPTPAASRSCEASNTEARSAPVSVSSAP